MICTIGEKHSTNGSKLLNDTIMSKNQCIQKFTHYALFISFWSDISFVMTNGHLTDASGWHHLPRYWIWLKSRSLLVTVGGLMLFAANITLLFSQGKCEERARRNMKQF